MSAADQGDGEGEDEADRLLTARVATSDDVEPPGGGDGGDGGDGGRQSAITPLPVKCMFALVTTAITEGFQMNVIWSFLPFMVEDLGHPGSPEQLGLWTGLMASSFFAGQIVASLIWPPLSDHIGRRKALLVGQL